MTTSKKFYKLLHEKYKLNENEKLNYEVDVSADLIVCEILSKHLVYANGNVYLTGIELGSTEEQILKDYIELCRLTRAKNDR